MEAVTSLSDDEWVIIGPLAHPHNQQQDDGFALQDDDDDDDDGLLLDRCNDEDDDYVDDLHDWALDEYKQQSISSSRAHAMDRYDSDLIRETWQEYVCSVGMPAREEVHQAKMMSFRGYGPDPAPFLHGSDCFNPLFESMWLPWAIDAQYCHNKDIGLLVSEVGANGSDLHMLAAHLYTKAAVPTRPVLECMVNHAPNQKIAHINGTSSLYWASLLRRLGANILLVSDYPSLGRSKVKSRFGDFHITGEESFFEHNLANEHAMFFCQPSEKSKGLVVDDDDDDVQKSYHLFERCLFCFPGDTVFFVGEIGQTTKSFDMVKWVSDNKEQGWRIKKKIELPCWPGSQEVFLGCVKSEHSDGA